MHSFPIPPVFVDSVDILPLGVIERFRILVLRLATPAILVISLSVVPVAVKAALRFL